MLMCFCEETMSLEMGSGKIYATRCGHIFHDSCLKDWIAKSESCPVCRSPVTQNEIIRLYPALCGEDAIQDLNDVLQSCLESLDDTKYQLEHMTALCNEKDNIIANKIETERDRIVQLEQMNALSREKDEIIAKLKINMDRVKMLGQASEALDSLVRMLDGLKGMATIICKTADKSIQQDLATQPSTESTVTDTSVSQPRNETSNADASVSQPRAETSNAEASVSQPRAETSNADASVSQPRAEISNADAFVSQPSAETSNADAAETQPSTESIESDSALTQPETASSDDNILVTSDLDVTEIESSSELPNEASITERINNAQSESEDDANINRSQAESSVDLTQPNSQETDDGALAHNNNTSVVSSVDDETAAIKSSINTLEHMLLRISEIKKSSNQ